jgi:tripeptide aminopeptidase
MTSVSDRFLKYTRIDTQSDEASPTYPSTAKQFDLARVLVDELLALSLKDAHVDENCYVMATLPANQGGIVPVIGFIAHMDTSPDISGTGVNPKVWEHYDGGEIILNKDKNVLLSPKAFPELSRYKGQTLITSDGNTLLGADDKAGAAIIMSAVEYLVNHPEIKHGMIKIGFTPDEEIGRGVDRFDVEKFGADFAYTLDGGELGELEYNTFNAASAKVTIQGKIVHPGYAKNIMKNAILIGMELQAMLPEHERPAYTSGWEGFYHLMDMRGGVDQTTMTYLIRDYERPKFEHMKTLFEKASDYLNEKFGEGTVSVEITDSYYNLREKIEAVFHIVETAEKAIREVGLTPRIVPVRGGTDGSRLSFMGLPTPNLFTGGHNFHSRYEYIPVESLEKSVQVVLKIIEMYAQNLG